MPKDERYPEYDWIQDRIDDLNKAKTDLEEAAKDIGPTNPYLVGSVRKMITHYLKLYSKFVEIAKKENIPMSLFINNELNEGVRYFVITNEEGNLNNLVEASLSYHTQNLYEGMKYQCVVDIKPV